MPSLYEILMVPTTVEAGVSFLGDYRSPTYQVLLLLGAVSLSLKHPTSLLPQL